MVRNKQKLSLLKASTLSIGMCCLWIGCKQEVKTDVNSSPVELTDQVQAVMKLQPFTYDPLDKTKVAGAYINKTKVSVPKTLSGQNKWFMFEGPVLENDKVAYRYYADTRHRFDIYGKKVSDLVMDTVSWDYHNIMNWGSDILKVGNSLGIGSPAILYQDSIYALEEWDTKTIEILTDTEDKATIRTFFDGLKIGNQSMNIQQDWTIAAGGYDTAIDIKRTDGDLPDDMKFATGIVSHLPDVNIYNKSDHYYNYTWGEQSFHKQNLGMAILAHNRYLPKAYDNDMSHITIFDKSKKGVNYKFMAVWADGIGSIDSEKKFKETVKAVASQLK